MKYPFTLSIDSDYIQLLMNRKTLSMREVRELAVKAFEDKIIELVPEAAVIRSVEAFRQANKKEKK